MKAAIVVLVLTVIGIGAFFGYHLLSDRKIGERKQVSSSQAEKPLEKYEIENLSKVGFQDSRIEFGRILREEGETVSRAFYFYVDGKKVSGQINYPVVGGTYPVIVMNRGYIEREGYKIGDGTRRSGVEFAKAGFVTVAPDFLGYGESDMPSENPMEERFQTYVVDLVLIHSVGNLNPAFLQSGMDVRVDPSKIGLWGHSNGGQITITVLEAAKFKCPTVLWAPVTKPFPYSILYYTDDFDDHGKRLRRAIADFEQDYDSELYSLTNYLDRIEAPISLHQGSSDSEVPIEWSGDFVLEMRKLKKQIDYFTYPEDDHNFANGNWDTVVARNIEFFNKNL